MFCGPLILQCEATMLRKKLRNVNARMSLSFGNYHKTNYRHYMHVSSCGLEEMCQNNLKPYAGELFVAVSTCRHCHLCVETGLTASVDRLLKCSTLQCICGHLQMSSI